MQARLPRAALAVLLAVGSAAVYAGTLSHGFVDLDDGHFVQDNPFVREGLSARSVRWAFTAHLTFDAWPYLDYWQPVTVLSRLLDVELFGMDPRGHHLVNVLLQALNAALLFLVLESMTRPASDSMGAGASYWRSAFVAAFWTFHPLRVESVAWITERKDMLAGLFWMSTLAAYVGYVRRPGLSRLVVVALSFMLGLMSKPFLVTLPFVLLLLDFWPLQRIGPWNRWRGAPRLVAEKVPLFALTAAAVVIGIRAQARADFLTTLASEPLSARVAGATVDYVRYLLKLLWPYPMALPQPDSPAWPARIVVASGVLLAAVTAFVFAQARRRPYLPVGWLWFLGVLVPVIGLVQPGRIPLTDRYTYLPHIGLAIMLGWGIPEALPATLRGARRLGPVAAIVLAAAMTASIVQARHWRDSVTLFEHAIAVTKDNYSAHYNLGSVLAAQGRTAESIAHLDRAKAIRPGPVENDLGTMLAAQGRLDEALVHFREAVRLEPRSADARNNLGVLLARQGKAAEARREYEEALRYRPRHADASYNLARLEAAEGRVDHALVRLGSALEANPALDGAYFLRGNLLAAAGRFEDAEAAFRSALRLRPGSADIHNNLGRLLALQGRAAEAMAEYDAALRLDRDHALARANRAELEASSPSIAPQRR
jgi:tetratricopeptide (TPR) repeat protein